MLPEFTTRRINHGRHSTLPRRRIGFYNPTAKESEEGLRIVQDRLAYWVGVGAQSSPTVDRLIKQAAKKAA